MSPLTVIVGGYFSLLCSTMGFLLWRDTRYLPDPVVYARWQRRLVRLRRLGIRLRMVREAVRQRLGRRTCGYCGWGYRHRSHCPHRGFIRRVHWDWD